MVHCHVDHPWGSVWIAIYWPDRGNLFWKCATSSCNQSLPSIVSVTTTSVQRHQIIQGFLCMIRWQNFVHAKYVWPLLDSHRRSNAFTSSLEINRRIKMAANFCPTVRVHTPICGWHYPYTGWEVGHKFLQPNLTFWTHQKPPNVTLEWYLKMFLTYSFRINYSIPFFLFCKKPTWMIHVDKKKSVIENNFSCYSWNGRSISRTLPASSHLILKQFNSQLCGTYSSFFLFFF